MFSAALLRNLSGAHAHLVSPSLVGPRGSWPGASMVPGVNGVAVRPCSWMEVAYRAEGERGSHASASRGVGVSEGMPGASHSLADLYLLVRSSVGWRDCVPDRAGGL